jgi:hypothetical protein
MAPSFGLAMRIFVRSSLHASTGLVRNTSAAPPSTAIEPRDGGMAWNGVRAA